MAKIYSPRHSARVERAQDYKWQMLHQFVDVESPSAEQIGEILFRVDSIQKMQRRAMQLQHLFEHFQLAKGNFGLVASHMKRTRAAIYLQIEKLGLKAEQLRNAFCIEDLIERSSVHSDLQKIEAWMHEANFLQGKIPKSVPRAIGGIVDVVRQDEAF